MKILAVDPGYDRLGIAIIEKLPRQKEQLLYSGCFLTSAKDTFYVRLEQVGYEICRVIEEFLPDALAMETLFFTNNQKTALHVAEARGVIMYEAKKHDLEIFEYSPIAVKVAVTGYGKSNKEQVISMVEKLITINKKISLDDEYDAIAVGLTCAAIDGKKI